MPFEPDHAAHVLRELARTKRGTTIALGAGLQTQLVFASDPVAARAALDAVIDDDPLRQGESLCGFTVQAPAFVEARNVDRVLICSEMFECELMQRARELFGSSIELVTSFDRSTSLVAALTQTQGELAARWTEFNDREALWLAADRLMTDLHDHLARAPEWRYGPERQLEEFRQLQAIIAPHAPIKGASILNAGCGRYHPLGQSILALAGGARSAHAFDIEIPLDEARSARAAAELVAHILLDPSPFDCSRHDLLARLEPFIDLAALQRGELRSAIRTTTALNCDVGSITDPRVAGSAYDIIFSRDVFEHLHDVPAALRALHDRLAPEGVLVLWIDCSDHRRYTSPQHFSHWSHVTEPATRQAERRDTNGLRFPHYADLFTHAGFHILDFTPTETEPVPAHVRPQLAPMYQKLSDADLAVCRALAVLRRGACKARDARALHAAAP